jgi:beta-phosphoglucomutase family hydrolase
MVQAVIFDMDDVVVNSTDAHGKAWDAVLSKYGVSIDKMDPESVKKLFGLRIKEIGAILLDYFGLDVDRDAFLEERNRIFLDIISKEIEPVEGIYSLLDRVEGKGLKLGLASSGVSKYVDLVLNRLEIKDRFDAIVTGDEVEHGKPDPECFLKAAYKLGVEPSECVVIEDAAHGVDAAKAAGMKAIGYNNPYHPYTQDLSKADLAVASLNDITDEAISRL